MSFRPLTNSIARRTFSSKVQAPQGRLAGKSIIVTGAGSGIGRGLVLRFAKEGANVIVSDVTGAEEETAKLAKDVGPGKFIPFKCDVSNVEAVQGLIKAAQTNYGRLDGLVNNAGINLAPHPIHELPEDDFEKVIAVNLKSVYYGMKYAIPLMLKNGEQGGSIINMASIGGLRATPQIPAYAASKGGVVMMGRQVALDYATKNIRVNSVCPGPVHTPMIDAVSPELYPSLMAQIPIGRFASVDDVASICTWLASDESKYFTGYEYVVDGGRICQ